MTKATLEDISQITADVLGLDAGDISAASSPENVDTWDSVQHLNLILAIEQHFGIEFLPEEIEEMKSVGAIVTTVNNRLTAST